MGVRLGDVLQFTEFQGLNQGPRAVALARLGRFDEAAALRAAFKGFDSED